MSKKSISQEVDTEYLEYGPFEGELQILANPTAQKRIHNGLTNAVKILTLITKKSDIQKSLAAGTPATLKPLWFGGNKKIPGLKGVRLSTVRSALGQIRKLQKLSVVATKSKGKI